MINLLQIQHLRNLLAVHIAPKTCNVIVGANGSGKTSLLEAIFLLSRGKSFRHHQPRRYIHHAHPHTTIYATFSDDSRLAIQKQQDASTLLRVDGLPVYAQSALSLRLPTLLIDPSSMDILEQGSHGRRQLLDWLAFYLEAQFHPQWLSYQRLLKQRNTLLKQTSVTAWQRQELRAWDEMLSTHAERLHDSRQRIFERWLPEFDNAVATLLPDLPAQLRLSYQAGFDTKYPLAKLLEEKFEQDLQSGYTRLGSHRADVQVHWRSVRSLDASTTMPMAALLTEDAEEENNIEQIDQLTKQQTVKEQAVHVLSRGQKKLLVTALRLSQLSLLLAEASGNISEGAAHQGLLCSHATPVVLLDDITAELDAQSLARLLSTLAQLPCQLFITSLDEAVVTQVQQLWSDVAVFHVKQGQVQPLP